MIPITKYLEEEGYCNISEIYRSDPDSLVFKAFCERAQEYFALKVVILKANVSIPNYNVNLIHENVIRCHEIKDFELNEEEYRIFKLDWADLGDLRTFRFKSNLTNFKILKSVVSGLEYLHANNVVHGDLKLSNILLFTKSAEIELRVADYDNFFPIHCSTQSVNILTPEYSAPEQTDSRTISTDIWAFGCMTYELCVGKLPYGSRADGDTINQIRNNIKFSSLGKEFWAIREPYRFIIFNCLQKNKKERYKEIYLLKNDLLPFTFRKKLVAMKSYFLGLITKKIQPSHNEN